MRPALFVVALFVLVPGCSSPVDSNPNVPLADRPARSIDAGGVDGGTARTEASTPRTLLVALEGSCPAPRVFAVGAARAWAVAGSAYVLGPEGAAVLAGSRIYNDMTGMGVDKVASIDRIGGVDLGHAWIARMTESRSAPTVWVTWRTAEGWKNTTLGSEYGFGGSLVEHPSGALWISSNDMYRGSRFEEYVSGEPTKRPKMPGLDMAGDEYGFLPDGELLVVGGGSGPKKLLRRWSPTHPVDDALVVRGAESDVLSLRIQRPSPASPRVVVGLVSGRGAAQKNQLFEWRAEKIAPVAASSELGSVFSWDLASDGTLYVLRSDGTLVHESPAGAIGKVAVGESGTVFAGPTSEPWIVGASGALYRFDHGTVTPMPLPAAVWPLGEATPALAKRVTVLGQDEAIVTATRIERGDGWKKPRTTTVVFSTDAPTTPLRCGAPLQPDAVYPFPPPAAESCTEPVVAIEKAIKTPALTKLGFDRSRAKAWGPPKDARTTVRMGTLAEARSAAQKLSAAGYDAEVVCGLPAWSEPVAAGR